MSWIKKDRILKAFGLCLVILFALLIFKDPFSERTLIPNFEPYPDAIYYLSPALNLIKGHGFNVNREGRVFNVNVPPMYSFSLVPVFILKADPRMAYYSNVVLAFVSLFLFWLILKKILENRLIIYFLLILYITNYFIYWVPSLVMAENLTLSLYLAGILLLLSRITVINAALISFLAVAVYATKYANIPVTLSLVSLYFIKLLSVKSQSVQKVRATLTLLGAFVFFFLGLAVFEELTKGRNIFTQITEHLYSIYRSVPRIIPQTNNTAAPSWFGFQYVAKNLPLYLNSIIGAPNRFLWDQTPLVPKVIAIFGLVGMLGGLLSKKMRYVALSIILLLFTTVIFMSIFYSFDARYIYIAIPSLLIGFGLLLTRITEKRKLLNIISIFLILIYLVGNFTRIKSQISLNLRYVETPWNYIAIVKTNEYFIKDKIVNGKKPILISALPPFLVDYYTNRNYTLLPLSYEQEFRNMKELVWGPNDYSDLPKLYTKYLNEGYDLYVSRSGLGNESYTNRDFNIITTEFDTKLVLQGCYDQCNIYSVKLKQNNAL